MPKATASKNDRVGATAFALFLIVALTFAIRGEGASSNASYFTAVASAIATILSIGLNVASKQFHVKVREQIVISAYTSTIWIMLSFMFFKIFFRGSVWFVTLEQYLGDNYGAVLAPAIIAVLFIYICFVLKAIFIDRCPINARGLFHGFLITFFSGVIVVVISLVEARS